MSERIVTIQRCDACNGVGWFQDDYQYQPPFTGERCESCEGTGWEAHLNLEALKAALKGDAE